MGAESVGVSIRLSINERPALTRKKTCCQARSGKSNSSVLLLPSHSSTSRFGTAAHIFCMAFLTPVPNKPKPVIPDHETCLVVAILLLP